MSGMNLTLVNGFGWNFINANLNGSLNVIKMEIAVIQETPVFASPTDPVKSQDCGQFKASLMGSRCHCDHVEC